MGLIHCSRGYKLVLIKLLGWSNKTAWMLNNACCPDWNYARRLNNCCSNGILECLMDSMLLKFTWIEISKLKL